MPSRVWNGNGAVALLDSVREEHALLLEHCDPGTALGDLTDQDAILDIGADVLFQLWAAPAPAEPFEPLEAVTDWFAELITERQATARPSAPAAVGRRSSRSAP